MNSEENLCGCTDGTCKLFDERFDVKRIEEVFDLWYNSYQLTETINYTTFDNMYMPLKSFYKDGENIYKVLFECDHILPPNSTNIIKNYKLSFDSDNYARINISPLSLPKMKDVWIVVPTTSSTSFHNIFMFMQNFLEDNSNDINNENKPNFRICYNLRRGQIYFASTKNDKTVSLNYRYSPKIY